MNKNNSKLSSCLGIGSPFIDIISVVPDEQYLAKMGLSSGSRSDMTLEKLKSIHARIQNKKLTYHDLMNNQKKSVILEDDGVNGELNYIGGSSANTIYNMRVLGEPVSFVGTVADDVFGDFFTHVFFKQSNIPAYWEEWDTNKPVCFKQISCNAKNYTSVCAIYITPDGERTMEVYSGSVGNSIGIEDIRPAITQARSIFTESYELVFCKDKNLPEYIFKTAESLDLCTAISLSDKDVVLQNRDFIDNCVQRKAVKIVFGTEDEFRALTGANTNEDLLASIVKCCTTHNKTMAITRGAHGAWVITNKGKVLNIKAVNINNNLINTSGAGDGFASGYLLGYFSKPDSPEICGKLGALVGSAIVQTQGSNLVDVPEAEIALIRKNMHALLNGN